PVEKLRRLDRVAASTECKSIDSELLTDEECRKFNHHVRRNRGELLFAKYWLLVEGETDVSVFVVCADILGINLHRNGVRIVECSQAGGPSIFIKVADSLGINWHVVADNDQGGQKYAAAAKKLLNNRSEDEHISTLSASNMDVLLCISGYGAPYLKSVSRQSSNYEDCSWEDVLEEMKKTFSEKPGQALSVARKLADRSQPEINAEENTPEYWEQIYKCLNRRFSKPAAAFESVLLIQEKGRDGVPDEIKNILTKLTASAGGEQ
ncbi:MAG: hypothetical protein DRI57_12295, partial [Deltaproteobacteria bacterium]